jgi:hypothetical protein
MNGFQLKGWNDEVVRCSLLGFVIPVQTGIHVFSMVKSTFQAAKPA